MEFIKLGILEGKGLINLKPNQLSVHVKLKIAKY